jgi:DNA-binding transcriptional LysR family regulator
MLNLNQLETFVAIIDAGGFYEAAERLGVSQPTVSQQLRKLEEELGVTLVVRDRSQPSTTSSGARLLPLARSLLNAAARTRDVIAGGKLVLGASTNIGTYLLQPSIARYARESGSLNSIGVSIDSNPNVARQLSNGEIDLALMEWWDDRSGFSASRWHQERMVVIVAPDHRFANRKAVKPEVLFEEPMIGGESGTGTATLLRQFFGKEAASLRTVMTLGSTEAVKSAVRAGLGISLVFASAVASEVNSGELVALPVAGVKLVKDLFAIMPAGTPPDAPSWRFVRMLQNA